MRAIVFRVDRNHSLVLALPQFKLNLAISLTLNHPIRQFSPVVVYNLVQRIIGDHFRGGYGEPFVVITCIRIPLDHRAPTRVFAGFGAGVDRDIRRQRSGLIVRVNGEKACGRVNRNVRSAGSVAALNVHVAHDINCRRDER